MIFNGNFFIYRPIRVKLSGIFALPWAKPGRNFPGKPGVAGEVENLTPNFSPPNYSRAAVEGGLDAGARALPNIT